MLVRVIHRVLGFRDLDWVSVLSGRRVGLLRRERFIFGFRLQRPFLKSLRDVHKRHQGSRSRWFKTVGDGVGLEGRRDVEGRTGFGRAETAVLRGSSRGRMSLKIAKFKVRRRVQN